MILKEINQYIDQYTEEGIKSFEIHIQNVLNDITISIVNKFSNYTKPNKPNRKKSISKIKCSNFEKTKPQQENDELVKNRVFYLKVQDFFDNYSFIICG